MIYSNSKLILKVKCFVFFEKPFECLTNIWIAIDVWSRYDVLNGIDKYIQRITVCFLYPDITNLNNNEIDDFQELFLNLLLDIKDGLCNYCRSNCRTNMSTVRRGCITTFSCTTTHTADDLSIRIRLGWKKSLTFISLRRMLKTG